MAASTEPRYSFKNIAVLPVDSAPQALEMRMNRPAKRNAMTREFWLEIGQFFQEVADDPDCRCVVVTGAGPMFSAGIDLEGGAALSGIPGQKPRLDAARVALGTIRGGSQWQRAFAAIADCGKPVIACVHGGCFGAGLELVAHVDIRFCTADAFFVAPEVDIALAADIGGLQQLPKIIGNDSLLRELMLSGRRMGAQEAKEFGLVSRICADQDQMRQQAFELARAIAAKSPVATHGIKTLLNYTRDHTVEDSRRFAITWNAAMIQTRDTAIAGKAMMTKEEAKFENLVPLRGDRTLSKL